MPLHRLVIAALVLIPASAEAQSTTFSHLLDGTVAYRAPLPWHVARRIVAAGAEGALLEYQEERDTALSAAVVAYRLPPGTSFNRWTDSTLATAMLGPDAVRVADTLTAPNLRSLLWRTDSILAMDHFVRTEQGVLWIRVLMPAQPPHPAIIKARLHAIDDLMTTVRTDAHLAFPNGSELGLIVF